MKELALKRFPNVFPYVVVFSAALFFAYELMQFHMMNAIAPFLMRDLNMNATSFGNLCSVYLLADVLFLLPAGILLDRFSIRRVVLWALLLCILGTVGFALANKFIVAAFFHFLSGIGNAFCFLSCMMLVSRWFPIEKHALIMGIVITIGMLGGVVAQSPVSYLAEMFTWRKVLFIDATIGAVIYGIICLFVYDREEISSLERQVPFLKSIRSAFANMQNIAAGLYTALMNLPLMILGATFGSLFLTQVHGITLAKSSFISSMICMGTIIGSPLYGYLSNTWVSRALLMFIGAIFSLITMLCILCLSTLSEPMLVLLFFLLGVFSSAQILSYPIIAERNPKELTGTCMGVSGIIIMGLPMFVGPIVGLILDMFWKGGMFGDARFYPCEAFHYSLLLLPIGFIFSIAALIFLYPKKEAYTQIS